MIEPVSGTPAFNAELLPVSASFIRDFHCCGREP
jgi:hypothetical protein